MPHIVFPFTIIRRTCHMPQNSSSVLFIIFPFPCLISSFHSPLYVAPVICRKIPRPFFLLFSHSHASYRLSIHHYTSHLSYAAKFLVRSFYYFPIPMPHIVFPFTIIRRTCHMPQNSSSVLFIIFPF